MAAGKDIADGRQAEVGRTRLRTVLLCDLVASTALIERLGDQRGSDCIRAHDRFARDLMQRHGGREIDKTDGFLLLFERPAQALAFALGYQRGLAKLGEAFGARLSARVGIHVGEVVLWDNSPADIAGGAKSTEVEGLAKPVAARLMQLALPGQVLLSEVACTLAQRGEDALDPESAGRLRWLRHGRYRFRGLPLPLEVHEVGEPGIAPLSPPPSGGKAQRELPWWRSPSMVALQLVALVLAVAVVLYAVLRPQPVIAFAERDWLVVAHFDNLTGEAGFDGGLDVALRTALEQSPHVSLLPVLRVRDALGRMALPTDARVDRDIGSEVALREGARALLLPTVAEVGGRVRISLELVDPHTRSTVYAESADGNGAESVLASVAEAGARLRARLGEAMVSIERGGLPLAKATSPSLDALRAYSLGLQADSETRDEDARSHYQQALALDPGFALARASLGRYHFGRGEHAQALALWHEALEQEDRLSARDRLSLRGLVALAERRPDYPRQWKALAELYPDHYPATHNYALAMWYGNRFDEGIDHARRAAHRDSSTSAASSYVLGCLLLGAGRVDEALSAFDRATAFGHGGGHSVMHAAAWATLRRYDKAAMVLRRQPPGSPAQRLERRLLDLSMAIDRGDWERLPRLGEALAEQADRMGDSQVRWSAHAAALAVDRIDGSAPAAAALLAEARSALPQATPFEHERLGTVILYAGYVAAREGDTASARESIDAARPLLADAPFPTLANLQAIIEARLDIAAGDPARARARLQGFVDGSELYLTRMLLGEAEAALGNRTAALAHMQWLATHRGRAYAEFGGGQALQAENIVQANRALLRIAELALELGERGTARANQQAFRSAWPALAHAPELAARADAVEAALAH